MPLFSEKVLRLLQRIPRGKVTTYKAIARKLRTRAYRAVGNALHANEQPDVFHCFKVVKSDGSLGGYALGSKEKTRRLNAEGIRTRNNRIADFDTVFYGFR